MNYPFNLIKILLFLLLLPGMCFVSGCEDDDCECKNSSVSLVDKAGQEIKKTDPDAFIAWAGGRRSDGQPMSSPKEEGSWSLLAVSLPQNQALAGSDIGAYWWMDYDGETFSVRELAFPFGVVYTDIGVVTMEVSEAWRLATNAGYAGSFSFWELFQPLNPVATDVPLYVFSMTDGSFVLVNTVTQEVTQEWQRQSLSESRDAWDCYTACRNSYYNCLDNCRENFPGESWCYDRCEERRMDCDDGCMW